MSELTNNGTTTGDEIKELGDTKLSPSAASYITNVGYIPEVTKESMTPKEIKASRKERTRGLVKGKPHIKMDKVDWNNLMPELSEVFEALKVSVEACNVMRTMEINKDVLNGYLTSAREIKKETDAIIKEIKKFTASNSTSVIDYTSISADISHVATMAAALAGDTTTEMVSLEIEIGNDGLQSSLDSMLKVNDELIETIKTGGSNGIK